MSLSNVTISLGIDFQSQNARIVLTDSSDLVSNGVALNDAIGIVEVASGAGTVAYGDLAGTVVWDYDTSLVNAIPIIFPKDVNGVFVTGTYSFKVTIKQISTGATITQTVTATFCNDGPYPDVDLTFNCLCGPLVTAVDSTAYFPPNETPWSITARTLTLYGPQGTSWATTLATQDRIDTGSSSAWSGTYEAKLAITIQRTIGAVTETYVRTETFKGEFECISACELKCLMSIARNRVLEAKSRDKDTAEYTYHKVSSRVTHFAQSQDCGDGETMAALVSEIKNILNVTDGCCGCGDGQPSLISPLCSGSGSTVTITQAAFLDVSGIHPNFTIGLSASGQAILNNTYNTNNVAGTGISITRSTVSGNPDERTDTINSTIEQVHRWSGIVNINFSGGGLPTYSVQEENNYGTKFNPYSSWTITNLAGTILDNAEFEVSGFLASGTGNDPFVPGVEVTTIDVGGRVVQYPPEAFVFYRDDSVFTQNFRVGFRWPWGPNIDIQSIQAANIAVIELKITLDIK